MLVLLGTFTKLSRDMGKTKGAPVIEKVKIKCGIEWHVTRALMRSLFH